MKVRKRFLHVDASPRAKRSRSRAIAEALIDAAPGDVQFDTFSVWEADLPDLGGDMIEGRYDLIMGRPLPDDLAERWTAVRDIGERFLGYDGYLVSTPMWNFGLPYRLKHYLDVLTQPGLLFSNDTSGNVTGHAAGKKGIVIAASAMTFGRGGASDALDFQLAYLRAWFGFIGMPAIEAIRVAPTFGEQQDIESAMARASDEARDLGAAL